MLESEKAEVIIFAKEVSDYEDQLKHFADWPVNITLCESFKDLSRLLISDALLIIAENEMIRKYGTLEEFLLMTDTMMKFTGVQNKPKIGVGFSKEITDKEVKAIQKNSISLFPNLIQYGAEEARKAILEFIETGRSWPKYLLNEISGNKTKSKFKDVQLTNRQQQVYDLIANRGLSNKQIARVLNISESTVKIHVSAIMKALCVRNRTQLALTK